MKYLSKFFLLACLTLALAACGDSGIVVDTSDRSMEFMPADLVINVGDTVTFQMTSTHNAIEISKETYDTGGIDALEGGFAVDYGETKDVTFTEAGVHYYVCQPHVTVGMLGTITVQ